MASSDIVFAISIVVFIIAFAVVVLRLVWLERVRGEAQLRNYTPRTPSKQTAEWGRIVRREKDLLH